MHRLAGTGSVTVGGLVCPPETNPETDRFVALNDFD